MQASITNLVLKDLGSRYHRGAQYDAVVLAVERTLAHAKKRLVRHISLLAPSAHDGEDQYTVDTRNTIEFIAREVNSYVFD